MRNHFLISVLVILTMSGCQSTQIARERGPVSGSADPTQLVQLAQRTRDVAQRNEYLLRAAQLYLHLPPATLPNQQPNLQTQPATPILASQAQLALHALEQIDARVLTPAQTDRYARLRARSWMTLNNANEARLAMSGVRKYNSADFYLLGQACQALADYQCAADGYIQSVISHQFSDPALPSDINDQIWLALSKASQGPAMFASNEHHGWWLLQQQLRSAGSAAAQTSVWQRWRLDNALHPAALNPPQALRRMASYQMPRIGVMLPLSGQLAGAGGAVRDGIIVATLAEANTNAPSVLFYDSAAQDIAGVFEAVLADGCDVVVGPLVKSQVEKFARISAHSDTPRLLLNYLPSYLPSSQPNGGNNIAPPANQFQLGIAIEDEVTSLAQHVLLQGHRKVGVIHNQSSWAQRGLEAYREHWPYPLILTAFNEIKELTPAVGQTMLVADSQARHVEISNMLGEQLEFQPRARGDLDAIIALTSHIESQALVPALRYHYAKNIPVYTTSQATRGNKMASLKGFNATHMPVFTAADEKSQQLVSAFNMAQNPYGELYALGYDAFKVATWLPLIDHDSQTALPGASGLLQLNQHGRFQRTLPIGVVGVDGTIAKQD